MSSRAIISDRQEEEIINTGESAEYGTLLPHSPLVSKTSSNDPEIQVEPVELSRGRAYLTIATFSLFTVLGSMANGLLIISIPRIQEDLGMSEGLALWPVSIYGLVMGCLLLLFGAIADLVGSRGVNLVGTFFLGASLVGDAVSQNSLQLIAFRGLQGLGASMSYPTAVSMLSYSFPKGQLRSIAFAFLGFGQPLGFCLGLVSGGFFETYWGSWRTGFHISGGIIIALTVANIWLLPQNRIKKSSLTMRRLQKEIDWVGVLISGICLGTFSYILAIITDSTSRMKEPVNVTLLVTSIVLMPAFVLWMHFQEKHGRPALIPNSLWRQTEFSAVCAMVLISWGVIESMELFFSMFFQKVQHHDAVSASLRFLPSVLTGMLLNIFTGFLVHKFNMGSLVTFTTFLSVGSSLLMAVIDPKWPYWRGALWATALSPLACDVIFTIANLVTTKAFAEDTQGLAGAVFNTVAQLGGSLGIAIMASINSAAKQIASDKVPHMREEDLLMIGYRAVWWVDTGLMMAATLIGAIALRQLGRMEL